MAVEVYLGDAPGYVKRWVEEKEREKLREPLCFTAVDDGATIQLEKTGEPYSIQIVYSTDKTTWNNYDFTPVTLANAEDKVYFRAKTENNVPFYKDYSNYYRFKTTTGKKVIASGNLQTLMKADGSRLDISDKPNCYLYMFSNCKSLQQAPELPATTLASDCYSCMFLGCTSLTQAPELPATTLVEACYAQMFQHCTFLQTAPTLPATTLVDRCYSNMFQDCRSLNSMDVSFTTWDPSTATDSWMTNAGTDASNPVFTCPSALDTSTIQDGSHVPNGWSIQPK